MNSLAPATEPANGNEEQLLWQGGFSVRSMSGAWIGCAVITVVLLLLLSRVAVLREIQLAKITVYLLIGSMWLSVAAVSIYRKLAHRYRFTNLQLIHQNGSLIRHESRFNLDGVEQVNYRQGPIQRLLDVGTVQLEMGDDRKPARFPGVGNILEVTSQIENARQAERKKRGLR